MIGTLAVDRWAATFGITMRGMGGLRPGPVPSSLYGVPNVTAHPSTASVPHSYYGYGTIIGFALGP